MNLHSDRAAFELIIDEVANSSGVRRDVLEKDYYVTLMLKELADRPHQGYAYFKGGTALYKALRSIRRFSEDIDLKVYYDSLYQLDENDVLQRFGKVKVEATSFTVKLFE